MEAYAKEINWWQHPEAKVLINAAKIYLLSVLPTLKGDNFICFDNVFKETNLHRPTKLNFWNYLPRDWQQVPTQTIIGDYENLALLSDRIDNFILPYILDYSENSRAILKEIWRCLVPEGRVVIFGFNSYSLFGLPKFLKKSHPSQHLLAEPELRQALQNQGFYIETFKTFYFRPKFMYGKDNGIARLSEILGNLFWPALGCMCVYVAQKPVLGMTPSAAVQKVKKVVLPKGAVEPSANYRK